MSVTIKMIADRAGVSTGTVNRALNGKDRIKEQTRQKILKIADEMGYQANTAAKALGTKRKPIRIGAIIFPQNFYGHEDIFSLIYAGLQQAAEKYTAYGMQTTIMQMKSYTAEEQLQAIDTLKQQGISALIISVVDDQAVVRQLHALQEEGMLVIAVNVDLQNTERFCFIGQNLCQSGRTAAHLLYQMNHTLMEAAILGGIPQARSAEDRMYGFKQYFQENLPGVPVYQKHQEICYPEDIYLQAGKLLDEHAELNCFCVTTFSPRGLVRALRERNRQAYIVGFDDTRENIQLLKNGEINFLIAQQPERQGTMSMDILFDYFFNKIRPERNNIYTKIEILSRENL